MGNIDFRAKQQELLNTQQQLRDTQAELDDKTNQLENARLKNENEKSELIEQLLSEIDALKENAKNYEQQIKDINAELNTLRTHFNNINQISQQTVDEQTTSQQTTVDQTTTQQTTVDQTTTQQTTVDQTTSQQTVDEQITSQQTVDEQITSQQTVDEQITSQQTVDEQITSQQTVDEQTTSQQTVDEQTTSQQTVDEQPDIKLDSYEWYNKALSQLILDIDWCIATAKYKRWLNKSWKETLKTAKAKLKQYRGIITGKKEHLEHEFKQKNKLNAKNPDKVPLTVSISTAEINELKRRRGDRRKKIENDIKEWQIGKSSNTAPRPNQSLEQVNKWNTVDNHHIEYDSRLNEALQDAAFLRIIDNNQDRAREFLQAIANNSLSDAQITICHIRKAQLDPYFEKYGLSNQVHRCIQTRGWRYTQNVVNYWNMDWETAYKTWWVVGWLNNTLIKAFPNAKPDQVSSFTNLAVAAGWIYAIYRIWKRFFGKNKDWERNLLWKAAGLASIYFVPQLLLWKDWYSLLWDILTWKADFWELWYRASNCLWFMNNSSPEVYAQMAPWVLWMSIFPQNYTVKDVKSLQQTFSDQNSRRQRYTVTYNRLNKDNSALANEFKNTFNANQYNENERKAFLAKLWITDNTSDDTVIFNEAMKLTDKKTSLELRMKSQWKKRNPVFNKEIDEYLRQGWEFNPNDLKDKDNWFILDKEVAYTERPEDEKNRKALENQVESLSISDPQKKSDLKTAIIRFYNERSIDTKPNLSDFNLKTENGFVILKSHSWQETKIDINKWELVWFWNWIRFSDLSELLNVADLSNRILETQKWKQPKDMPPFQYKIGKGWRWIYFNDAEDWSLNFDTRILSWGLWWSIGKIDTLSNPNNAEEFAKYLSKRRENINKVNLDSINYPILHNFSEKTKIIFTNEQEAKDLELWLKEIKNWKKFAIWQQGWNPFSISRQFKTFDNRLVFTAINWTNEVFKEDISEKFPTIMRNKDDFLKFMNDKNNWMRWSALNR